MINSNAVKEHQTSAALPLKVRSLGNLLSEPIPPKDTILSPWLDERHLCLIHAPTGLGKSFLSLGIGLAIASGGSILGWHAPAPKKVMLIDGEMDIEDIQSRCKHLLPSIGGDAESASENLVIMARQDQDISTKFPDFASEEGQNVALTYISSHNPDVIILDNFGTLCDVEDENSASSFNPMLTFLGRLKQGRKAVVLIHHSRKGSGGNGTYRGTSKIATPFNSIISLATPKLSDPTGAHFELRWEKFRGLRVESMSDLDVKLNGGEWHYQPLEADNLGRFAALVKTCEHPDQESLAKALNVNQSTISKYKAKAIAEGHITAREYEFCMKQARELTHDFWKDTLDGDYIPEFHPRESRENL